ncbi:MAG: hypothetical protein HOQ05_03150 [Corynebacteriales bacterium]|nr:hypothetical protein [Mycobacteriales bacterium]
MNLGIELHYELFKATNAELQQKAARERLSLAILRRSIKRITNRKSTESQQSQTSFGTVGPEKSLAC